MKVAEYDTVMLKQGSEKKVTSTCQFVFSVVELRWLVWFLAYFFVCIFIVCGENVSS